MSKKKSATLTYVSASLAQAASGLAVPYVSCGGRVLRYPRPGRMTDAWRYLFVVGVVMMIAILNSSRINVAVACITLPFPMLQNQWR